MINKAVKEDKDLDYIILMDSDRMAYIHTKKPELEQEVISDKEDLFAAKQQNVAIHKFENNGIDFMEFIAQIYVSTIHGECLDWAFL